MGETKPEDNEHIKQMLGGKDFTKGIDDEFRERMINELRTFPNIFVIAGDENGATHTMQGDNEQMGRCIIHIFKQKPELAKWFKEILDYV